MVGPLTVRRSWFDHDLKWSAEGLVCRGGLYLPEGLSLFRDVRNRPARRRSGQPRHDHRGRVPLGSKPESHRSDVRGAGQHIRAGRGPGESGEVVAYAARGHPPAEADRSGRGRVTMERWPRRGLASDPRSGRQAQDSRAPQPSWRRFVAKQAVEGHEGRQDDAAVEPEAVAATKKPVESSRARRERDRCRRRSRVSSRPGASMSARARSAVTSSGSRTRPGGRRAVRHKAPLQVAGRHWPSGTARSRSVESCHEDVRPGPYGAP